MLDVTTDRALGLLVLVVVVLPRAAEGDPDAARRRGVGGVSEEDAAAGRGARGLLPAAAARSGLSTRRAPPARLRRAPPERGVSSLLRAGERVGVTAFSWAGKTRRVSGGGGE